MQSITTTASRHVRRLSRRLPNVVEQVVKTSYREYTGSNICNECRARLSKPRISSKQIQTRSWTRFASTSASSGTTEEPMKTTSTPPRTHYEFFPKTLPSGPPPTGPFIIDPRELRREFLQLQAVAHPDRHPPGFKAKAEGISARINEAYKTLQNPLLRAQYLLSQRGIDVAEDETAKVDDPELLMEVLDAREDIEAAQDEEELVEMKKVNQERIERSEKILDEAFRTDDMEMARGEAVKLRYWINISDSVDAWEKGKPVVLLH